MTTKPKQRPKPQPTGPTPEQMRSEKLRAVGVVLMLLGVVSLLTSIFFLASKGTRQFKGFPPEGGTVGPIVLERNTLLHVTVRQGLVQEGWSYVEGELRDAAGNPRFRFGGELWRESGVDSEGYSWAESDTYYDVRILVPVAGTYHIAFEAEAGYVGVMTPVPASEIAGSMYVSVQPTRGSPVPFRTAGFLFLLVGFLLHEMATGAFARFLSQLELS